MSKVLDIVTATAVVRLEDIDFLWSLRPSVGWMVQLKEGLHLGAQRFTLRTAPEHQRTPYRTPVLLSSRSGYTNLPGYGPSLTPLPRPPSPRNDRPSPLRSEIPTAWTNVPESVRSHLSSDGTPTASTAQGEEPGTKARVSRAVPGRRGQSLEEALAAVSPLTVSLQRPDQTGSGSDVASLNSQIVELVAWKNDVASKFGAIHSRIGQLDVTMASTSSSLSQLQASAARIEERVGAAEKLMDAKVAEIYADNNVKYDRIMEYLTTHLPAKSASLSQTQRYPHDG